MTAQQILARNHIASAALLCPWLVGKGQLVVAAEWILDRPDADPIVRGLAMELLDERAEYESGIRDECKGRLIEHC